MKHLSLLKIIGNTYFWNAGLRVMNPMVSSKKSPKSKNMYFCNALITAILTRATFVPECLLIPTLGPNLELKSACFFHWIYHLVGGFKPIRNILGQNVNLPQVGGENQKKWNQTTT